MSDFRLRASLGSLSAAALLVFAPQAQAATTLKVGSGLTRNHDQIVVYFDHFHNPMNKANGPVKLNYLGGPEITPTAQLGPAVKRGILDLLVSPSSYYAGYVTEGRYIAISNKGHKELRANGIYDDLQKAWAKGINARIIAWPYWGGTEFHLYVIDKPALSKATGISLKGVKMRSVSLYTPFLKALGATPVTIAPPEVYTGLQRGVVAGVPWPEGAITKYGWQKIVKYKVEPGFWRSSTLVIMNLDKYNSLTKAERDYIDAAGVKLEDESGPAQRKIIDVDNAKVFKEGVQRVKLEGDYAKAYIKTIFGATWAAAKDDKKLTVPYATLRAKLYKE